MAYEKLFTPGKIGNVEIKNRVVMPPMMLGFGQFDGTPTETMMNYYEERAIGGAGLIVTEITRVNDFSGASAFAQLAISHDYHIAPLKEMTDRVHRHGTKIFIQLQHPGRQNLGLIMGTVPVSIAMHRLIGNCYDNLFYKVAPMGKKLMEKDWVLKTSSPSACERAYSAESLNREMSIKEVRKIIQQFIDGAVRAKKAGADGVELHAAHGYLIQQFLSPYTNRRTDCYGGSFENRMRFLSEILTGIKSACGKDFPVIVRLSVDECYKEIGKPGVGYTLEDGVKMAKEIERLGADAIDVSSAGYDTYNYWLEPTSFEPGWRKYMAAAVKKAVSIPVLAANLIRSPEQAEEQLAEGIQDFICLGRPHIADPHWANKAKAGKANEIKRCICCLYCMESMQHNAYAGEHANCSVNPKLGHEKELLSRDGKGRTVVIVGAGPAGLSAAETLGKRGFKPIVLEKQSEAGGQLQLANKPPLKDKINWCIEDLVTAAVHNGAEIRYNTEATPELIASLSPYAVIIATGASSVKPRSIPGVDLPNVCTTTEILDGTIHLTKRKVAVIGSGMTGLETAELLCEQVNRVTVVEMADTIAPGTWMQHIDDCMPRLQAAGTEFLPAHKLCAIHDDCIELQDTKTQQTKKLDTSFVVLSLGVRSDNALYTLMKSRYKRIYCIGDAGKTGRIADATAQGYRIARDLE
ncbi:MAG: FAD-dependent oxidoreductase [Candidatus Fimenecus sp.]